MEQMQTPMAEFLQASMAKIKEMVDVNTVVGEPITTEFDGLMSGFSCILSMRMLHCSMTA